MKKAIIYFTIFLLLDINISFGFQDCSSQKKSYENLQAKVNNSYNKYLYTDIEDENKSNYYNDYKKLLNNFKTSEESYNLCIIKRNDEIVNANFMFENGYTSFKEGRFEEAIGYYIKYFTYNSDPNNADYKITKKNLITSYKSLGLVSFNKKNFDNAVLNYKNAVNLNPLDFQSNFNLGVSYYNIGDLNNSLIYYKKSFDLAINKKDIDNISKKIKEIEKEKINQELIKNAPTNDPLSGYQYYLKQLNINKAWDKVKNNKEVIVAVIDDGININHPDLINSIWVDPKGKYGKSKIIDFVGDGINSNLPVGEHGTMVGGLIGAIQNNKEGIAGIGKNVKLMPLRVFRKDSNAKDSNIIKAMDFAIENGANIINLSLGGSQFTNYTKTYDNIIKKANEKGIIVVIAGGNGDILSGKQTGVNLTNNPISPVCNNEAKILNSIGVFSTDKYGEQTKWTNYGNCTLFSAPGVDILSTSIPIYNKKYGNNYNISNGTSFSAPIISGIIALGYNQYGHIEPIDVYNSLLESYINIKLPNGEDGKILDASRYIDILGLKVNTKLNFEKIKINNINKTQKDKIYNELLTKLELSKDKLNGDKLIINNYFIYLIKKEINDDFK